MKVRRNIHAILKGLYQILRIPYRIINKIRLKNIDFSIISSNCLAGVMYHDAMQKFLSPTINLVVRNYLQFCKNLNYYLRQTPQIDINNVICPAMHIEDVKIDGIHYKNNEQLFHDWEKRKKRVNFNNLFLVATDRDFRTEKDLSEFDCLRYPKVYFTSKQKLDYEWMVYIPEFKNDEFVGDILKYKFLWKRIFEKHFDYISWLNNGRK